MVSSILSSTYQIYFGSLIPLHEGLQRTLSFEYVEPQISLPYRQLCWEEQIQSALGMISGYECMSVR